MPIRLTRPTLVFRQLVITTHAASIDVNADSTSMSAPIVVRSIGRALRIAIYATVAIVALRYGYLKMDMELSTRKGRHGVVIATIIAKAAVVEDMAKVATSLATSGMVVP